MNNLSRRMSWGLITMLTVTDQGAQWRQWGNRWLDEVLKNVMRQFTEMKYHMSPSSILVLEQMFFCSNRNTQVTSFLRSATWSWNFFKTNVFMFLSFKKRLYACSSWEKCCHPVVYMCPSCNGGQCDANVIFFKRFPVSYTLLYLVSQSSLFVFSHRRNKSI